MNKLQLVQEVCVRCGISASGPSSLTTPDSMVAKVIKWVDSAHREIQCKWVNWKFLWQSSTMDTVADQAVYDSNDTDFPANLSYWDRLRFGIGSVDLDCYDYQDRDRYLTPKTAKPTELYVRPDNTLEFYPTPDTAYTVSFDYYRTPMVLSAATDEPLIPERFQEIIIARAMVMFGNYEAAPEIKAEGQELYEMLLIQLENDQLPKNDTLHSQLGETGFMVVTE